MNRFVFILCLIIVLSINVLESAERQVIFSDARVMAMGNTFTAIADDKNMLFFNPAGFATYGLIKTSIIDAILNPTLWKPRYTNIGDLTIASTTIGISGLEDLTDGPLVKLYKMDFFNKFSENTLTEAEREEANNYIMKLYSKGFRPMLNIEMISYARHYFGLGIFTAADAILQLDPTQGISVLPNIQGKAYFDLIIPAGFGMRVPGYRDWSVGITMKYFHRAKIEFENIDDLIEVYQWTQQGSINKEIDKYFETHSIANILINGVEFTSTPVDQVKLGTGAGFDLGAMYRPEYEWKFGLLLSDVYTRINWWDKSEPSRIPINARLGAAYMPRFSLAGIIESPVLAADLEDVFHQQGKNFFLKWHFGTELKVLFRIFTLRFGINDGYFSSGIGIDFSFYFLSKIPVLQWLRPNSAYFPRFNPNSRDFVEKNPICCCLSGILAPLFYAHIKIDFTTTGYEAGVRPGQLPAYQQLFRVSFTYSY